MIEIKITADTAEQAKQDLSELAGVIGGTVKLKVAKEEEPEETKPKSTRSRTTTKKVEKEEEPEPEEEDPFGDDAGEDDDKITDKMLVDLAAEKREANEAKNMPKLKALLAEYNVKKFSEVDDDDRKDFLKKLKKI